MVRTKVFVGNLSFATKENELAKQFETAGKVISANIITRGPRSLGYGFVEMDNESDAEKAVQLLNKKEIDGRPINVEVAKLREEGAEGGEGQARTGGDRGGRGNGRGGRGGARGGRGRGFGGGFRRGGGNPGTEGGRRFRRVDGSDEEGENEQQEGGFRRRGGFTRGAPRGAPRERGAFRGGRGGGRPRQEERKEENRTPSSTTLFIANLPFSLDDEGFGKVFKDNALAFKSAHVVKRRSGRSKGFGFAEFDNEGDQQKALAALNNKPIEGRELVVKVALTEMREEEEAQNAPATEKKEETKTENKPVTPKAEKK